MENHNVVRHARLVAPILHEAMHRVEDAIDVIRFMEPPEDKRVFKKMIGRLMFEFGNAMKELAAIDVSPNRVWLLGDDPCSGLK